MGRLTRALYTLATWEIQAMLAGAVNARIQRDRKRSAEYRSKLIATDRSQLCAEFALDGTILNANPNFLKATGYSLDELVGQPHRMLCLPDSDEQEYRSFWTLLRDGQFHAGE